MARLLGKYLNLLDSLARKSFSLLNSWSVLCGLTSAIGKIVGATIIAVLSFYAVSFLERSFQIDIVPEEASGFRFTSIDESYEIKFFINNHGWSDRTLTGIELITESTPDSVKARLNAKAGEHRQNATVHLEEPSTRLIELKNRDFPVPLTKQSYTEIDLDKLSSYYISHSDKPIILHFDRDSIEVTKEQLGYANMTYSAHINDQTFEGDTSKIFDSISRLSRLDRILKSESQVCNEDVEPLILEREKQVTQLSSLEFFNQSDRYKKIKVFPFLFSGSLLLFYDFVKTIKQGPMTVSDSDYSDLATKLERLYFIEKMISAKKCKTLLAVFDKYYSLNSSIYTDRIQVSFKGQMPAISY